MPEIGTAYVRVSGDFTPLTSQLAGVVAPSKMSKLGKAAGVGLAAGFAAAGIGKMLFDVGKEFDEAYDNIRVQTGATGKEMGKLKKAFRDTIGSVPTDFDTASKAVAGLNQRLDTTGKPLARLSKQLTALSEVTGTDITENVEAVTRLFGDWSVKTKDQTDTLDGLFRIAQQTGGSVSELSRLLVQFGAPLRNLGIDLDFAAAMFANFERSGVNISTVLSGLRLSVGNLATPTDDLAQLLDKLGINAAKPEKALGQIFSDIKRLDDQASKALAIEVFGKRAGPDLRDAVVTGRFALQDLMREFQRGDGTIRKSERQTRDLEEQWQLFANRLKLFVEPIARDVFKGIGDLMRDVNRAFKKGGLEGVADLIADKLKEAIPKVIDAAGQVGAKIVPALLEGFLKAPDWAQLLGGAWILSKIGGKGLFSAAGSKAGQWFALAFIAAWEAKKIAEIISGEMLDATTRELKAKELEDAGYRSIQFVGRGMIAAISPTGNFGIFKQKHGKWVADIVSNHRQWDKIPRLANQQGQDTFKAWRGWLGKTREEGDRQGKAIARDTEQNLGKAEDSAEKHGKAAGRGISQPYEAASSSVVEALHRIERNTNSSLKELKQKPINFAIVDGKKTGTSGLQRGGPAFVGGRGTGDIVPAMLEPGEVVLNRKAVRALGGAGKANRINKRFPRFQEGGVAQPPGDPGSEVVQAAYAGEVGRFLGRFNMDLTQGYNPGGPSVSPGHLSLGAAPSLDVTPLDGNWDGLFAQGLKWALSQGMQVGYDGQYGTQSWSGHGEGDHAHIDWKSGGKLGAVVDKIKRILIEGPNHAAKNIAQGASDLAVKGANAMLAKIAPPVDTAGIGKGGVLSAAEFLTIANQAIGLTKPQSAGFSARGLLTLAMAESSLDPNSINLWDSNAAAGNPSGGLMHTTESTFRAYHEPGTANTYFDPLASIAASINYQDATYGGQVTHSPYQRGGIVQKLAGGGAVQGHGGESPSTPLFDWFRVMFDQPLVDQMKGIVGSIDVNPNRFENMAASYSDALDFDELGTVAMALDTDDPITGETIYGIARGRTAVGGLGSDLGSGWLDLELGQLLLVRDRILTAIPIVDTLTKFVKGKIDALTKPGKNSYESIAKRLYEEAKKAYDDLQDKIGNLRTQIKRLEGIKKPTGEQKQRLSDLKGRLNGLVNALGVAKQIMDDSKFRVGAVGDVAGAFGARATALDAVKVALKTDGAEDGSWPSLEELQGRTGEAGSIFDTKLEITEALRAVGERAVIDTEPGALETLSTELLQQQLEEQRRLTAVAEAQTPVFEQFFGRTFHTGGIVGGVGNQGVTVQAGEGIFTEDQMAAMGGSNVTVVVEDGAVDPNKIRVVVNDELSSVAARATRVGGTKGQKAVYR